MDQNSQVNVLIVEDNVIVSADIRMRVEKMGYKVSGCVTNGRAAIDILSRKVPDLILMDIKLRGNLTGIETYQEIRSHYNVPVIYITSYSDEDTIKQAKLTQPYGYIVKPFRDEDLKSLIEITIHKHKQELRLQKSENKYRDLYDKAPTMFVSVDALTAKLVHFNQTFVAELGYNKEELYNTTLISLIASDEPNKPTQEHFVEFLRTTVKRNETLILVSKDQKRVPVLLNVSPQYKENGEIATCFCVMRNIEKQKEMESKMIQLQRMEAIGNLSAGIAHEINTPLQYISDNLSFFEETFEDLLATLSKVRKLSREFSTKGSVKKDLSEKLENIIDKADIDYLSEDVPDAIFQSREGIEVIKHNVKSMKAFGDQERKGKIDIDLNDAISNAIVLSKSRWWDIADFTTELGDELPDILCYPSEMNQVFLNMIINACEAITAKNGSESDKKGMITVKTKGGKDGITISFRDTGIGIPTSIIDKVFDHFFTTKPLGQGTGQGLSIVYNVIVNKHGGNIKIESQPDHGAVFTIYLPTNLSEEQ